MFTRQEKILLAVLASIQFCHIVDFMIMMPLGSQLMRIFNIDPHQFGALVAVYSLSAGISGFLSAFFMDRFDRKRCLQFFFIGFILGTVACGLAPTYYSLITARALTGTFGGVLGSIVLAIISDAIVFSKRGTAMGFVMAAFSVASILGVPFSLYLAGHFGWHAPFFFLGALSSGIFLLATFGIPPMRSHMQSGPRPAPWQIMREILGNKSQLSGLVFMFFLVMGHFTIIPFIAPSMVANAGFTENQLPLMYLVGGGVSIVASPLVGRIADLYGVRRIFAGSVAFSIIPVLLITNLTPHPVPLTLFFVALFFMSNSGRWIPAITLISSTAVPQKRGAYMSIVNSVQQISAAFSAYIAGLVVVEDGAGHLLRYPIAGYIAIASGIVAYFCSRSVQSVEGMRPVTGA